MLDEQILLLKSFVHDAVSKHWEEHHSPMLLSSLGASIKDAHPELMGVLDGSLRRFIESAHLAQVVTHPMSNQKIGAVPLDVAIPPDVASIFQPSRRSRFPRVVPQFWSAFYRPFAERRFIVLGSDASVNVVEGPDKPLSPIVAYEVLPTDLVDSTRQFRSDEVWDKIAKWLERHSLDISKFSDKGAVAVQAKSVVHRNSVERVALALSHLDPQDQSRILIPLDVVTKMFDAK